jgi:hypothetical protein
MSSEYTNVSIVHLEAIEAFESARSEKIAKNEAENQKLKEQLNQRTAHNRELQAELEEATGEKQKLQAEHDKAIAKSATFQAVICELQQKCRELNEQSNKATAEKEMLELILKEVLVFNTKLENENEQYTSEIITHEEAFNTLKIMCQHRFAKFMQREFQRLLQFLDNTFCKQCLLTNLLTNWRRSVYGCSNPKRTLNPLAGAPAEAPSETMDQSPLFSTPQLATPASAAVQSVHSLTYNTPKVQSFSGTQKKLALKLAAASGESDEITPAVTLKSETPSDDVIVTMQRTPEEALQNHNSTVAQVNLTAEEEENKYEEYFKMMKIDDMQKLAQMMKIDIFSKNIDKQGNPKPKPRKTLFADMKLNELSILAKDEGIPLVSGFTCSKNGKFKSFQRSELVGALGAKLFLEQKMFK